MKVFLNNRNYVTWTRTLAELLRDQGHEVTILDNGSTYEPLLEWYAECKFPIIRLPNLGSTAFWQQGLHERQTAPFVVTDCDCDISMVPGDWPEVLVEGLARFPNHTKVGLSWDNISVPEENAWHGWFRMGASPEGTPEIWDNNLLDGGWHNFPCDTSFAVYRPHRPFTIDGVRKTRPYTGIHWPFHLTLDPVDRVGKLSIPFTEEIAFYFENANLGQGGSYAATVLKEMVAEYRRRQKQ